MGNETIVHSRIDKWRDKHSVKTTSEVIESQVQSVVSDMKSMLDTDLVEQPSLR